MSDKRDYDRIHEINWAPSSFSGFDQIVIYGLIAAIGYLGYILSGIAFGLFAAAVVALLVYVLAKSTDKIVAAIGRARKKEGSFSHRDTLG